MVADGRRRSPRRRRRQSSIQLHSSKSGRWRGLVILSWFLLGKGQVLGVVIGLKVLFDKANLWDKINLPPGFEYGIFAAGLAAAVFAAVPDENEDDAYYPEIYGAKVLKADS